MSNSTTPSLSYRFSPCATLAALGIRLQGLNLFGKVRDAVHITQKTIIHTPVQKLYDAFIAILAGAHGFVEMNKRLRSDPGVQAAFGRQGWAEQSVVQDTLDACTEANVEQMHHAMDTIYRQQSRGYRHDYAQSVQVLDADMSGMPCGKKAAFATKGYFAGAKNCRGRQLGRVLATDQEEIVVDELFAGNVALVTALPGLGEAAERRLELTPGQRAPPIP